jgi:hypothetical protein
MEWLRLENEDAAREGYILLSLLCVLGVWGEKREEERGEGRKGGNKVRKKEIGNWKIFQTGNFWG